jgi:hypothetical protein
MTLAQQIVQTNHATFEMASTLTRINNATPSIVLIGVPDKKALDRVIDKLNTNQIKFSLFHEDDYDMGLTAVATVPLDEDQRAIMRNYKLWNESTFNTRVAQRSERQDSRQAYLEAGGSTPSARAMRGSPDDAEAQILVPSPSASSSAAEQGLLNSCVAGSIPA